ncbi:UDP-glycosyltransferase 92A1-like [Mangifera indica]|uniref:UDP-glycosyltransferase 92A1-like n=1 Tax=Mangifera indica TaxID=29780 RepID=UPI001CFAC2CA|nr:UDP-glycosyltransferase 92A1-like [Mangifera indica]
MSGKTNNLEFDYLVWRSFPTTQPTKSATISSARASQLFIKLIILLSSISLSSLIFNSTMSQTKEMIVMFPFMAQGHINPFLALALRIEKTNKYTVAFVNTPLNIKELRSSIPSNSSILLLELPFNSSDYGLPPNSENMNSVPSHLILNLFQASLSLKPDFRKLISNIIHQQNGQIPVCIISDMFLGWCEEIAQEFGVFHAIFITGGGFGYACFYSLWLNLPHRNTDSEEFALPDFPEAPRFHVTQMMDVLRYADGGDSPSSFTRKALSQWSKADGILFNTVEGIDKLGLTYFRRKFGRQVWSVGPLLLTPGSQAQSKRDFGISEEECKNWLDKKPECSVLYVSFGSQNNTISPSQMMQLAMALEASGKNFIWVVRPPLGFDINSEFRANEWLPEGFEERIRGSGRGLLVQKWAPQVEILCHKSVSVFLSHCGWNSVLESLSHGVPMIGWPMAAEQFYNVKLLEDMIGVCVEVARGKSCEVFHEDIVAKIKLVMNESEKGKEMREKTLEVKEIINNAIKDEENSKGASMEAMDQFLKAALNMKLRGESKREIQQ